MGLPVKTDVHGPHVIHTRTTRKRTYRTRVPIGYEPYVERRGGVVIRHVDVNGVKTPMRTRREIVRCPHCQRPFATAAGLELHLEDYHGKKAAQFADMAIAKGKAAPGDMPDFLRRKNTPGDDAA